jgi:hypothetical protein
MPIFALDLAHNQREHSVGKRRGANDPLAGSPRAPRVAALDGLHRVEEVLVAAAIAAGQTARH